MDIGIVLAVFMTLLIMMPLIIEIINEKKYKEEIDELINEVIDEEK
jgi:flagellar biosynthesis protein FliP